MSLIGLRIADCNNIIRRLKLVKLINFIHSYVDFLQYTLTYDISNTKV